MTQSWMASTPDLAALERAIALTRSVRCVCANQHNSPSKEAPMARIPRDVRDVLALALKQAYGGLILANLGVAFCAQRSAARFAGGV